MISRGSGVDILVQIRGFCGGLWSLLGLEDLGVNKVRVAELSLYVSW